jgi:hypothetical protein
MTGGRMIDARSKRMIELFRSIQGKHERRAVLPTSSLIRRHQARWTPSSISPEPGPGPLQNPTGFYYTATMRETSMYMEYQGLSDLYRKNLGRFFVQDQHIRTETRADASPLKSPRL